MLAKLNSLNAHNFPILQPILMIFVSNSWFIEVFLIKHTYYRVAVPFKYVFWKFICIPKRSHTNYYKIHYSRIWHFYKWLLGRFHALTGHLLFLFFLSDNIHEHALLLALKWYNISGVYGMCTPEQFCTDVIICIFFTYTRGLQKRITQTIYVLSYRTWERSGSVVECLTRDRRAAGSSLTGVTALWSLSKTHLS